MKSFKFNKYKYSKIRRVLNNILHFFSFNHYERVCYYDLNEAPYCSLINGIVGTDKCIKCKHCIGLDIMLFRPLFSNDQSLNHRRYTLKCCQNKHSIFNVIRKIVYKIQGKKPNLKLRKI